MSRLREIRAGLRRDVNHGRRAWEWLYKEGIVYAAGYAFTLGASASVALAERFLSGLDAGWESGEWLRDMDEKEHGDDG